MLMQHPCSSALLCLALLPPFLRHRFLTCFENSRLVAWEGKPYFEWSRGGEELPITKGLDLLCGAGGSCKAEQDNTGH